jgi:hypothetical protein
MEFFIPWWGKAKMALAALAAVVAISPFVYFYGHYKGAVSERTAIEGEIAKRTAELIKKRAKDNVELRNLGDRALCIELLPDGVPDSACD